MQIIDCSKYCWAIGSIMELHISFAFMTDSNDLSTFGSTQLYFIQQSMKKMSVTISTQQRPSNINPSVKPS